ncbi:hypothetical protein Q7P37_010766 [Cladosporium fusiforme]
MVVTTAPLPLAAITALLSGFAQAQYSNNSRTGYVDYSTVTGYFLQDEPDTVASGFDYTAVNFGLMNKTYSDSDAGNATQWQRFTQVVTSLNREADRDTVYKVLFMGRHGEGFHNAAESYYGTGAWNCYWSELDGNGTTVWADADLTESGIRQAQIANAYWKQQVATEYVPFPESYYTSPMTRCTRTANITFSDLELPSSSPFIPVVKEFFREGISTHTCDRRNSKTYIQNLFPEYVIEPGFTEEDELWSGILAEPSGAQDARSRQVLDDVFSKDNHTWLSITSHSGEIRSLLRVLGHREFSLGTGAVIPVLVKAQFLPEEDRPVTSVPAPTSTYFCANGPPITSVATSSPGCLCSSESVSGSTGVASTTAVPTAYGM